LEEAFLISLSCLTTSCRGIADKCSCWCISRLFWSGSGKRGLKN